MIFFANKSSKLISNSGFDTIAKAVDMQREKERIQRQMDDYARAYARYLEVKRKDPYNTQRLAELETACNSIGNGLDDTQLFVAKNHGEDIDSSKVYEAIVKGQPIPKAGIPESFKVFIKELQALGLDVLVQNAGSDVEVPIDEGFGDDQPSDYLDSEDTGSDFEVQYVDDSGSDMDGGYDDGGYGE